MMEHKGYVARIEFDESVGRLHGRVLDTRDVVSFESDDVGGIRAAFEEAIDDYLAFCDSRGEEPDKPFSGRILLRSSSDVHRAITLAAAEAGISVNEWATAVLREAAGRRYHQGA